MRKTDSQRGISKTSHGMGGGYKLILLSVLTSAALLAGVIFPGAATALAQEETLSIPEGEIPVEETVSEIPDEEMILEISGEEDTFAEEAKSALKGPSVYTLQKDETYDAKAFAGMGWMTIDLNGHTLKINGDFTTAHSLEIINSRHNMNQLKPASMFVYGNMTVNHDFWIDRDWEKSLGVDEEYESYSLVRVMGDLTVTGDALLATGYSYYSHLIDSYDPRKVTVEGNVKVNAQAMYAADSYVVGNMTLDGNAVYQADCYIGGDMTFNGSARSDCAYEDGAYIKGALIYNAGGDSYFEYLTLDKDSTDGNGGFQMGRGSGSVEILELNLAGNLSQSEGAGSMIIGTLTLNGTNRQTLSMQANSFIGSLPAKNRNVAVTGWLNANIESDFAPVLSGPVRSNCLSVRGCNLTLSNSLIFSGEGAVGKGYYGAELYVWEKEGAGGRQEGKLIIQGDLVSGGVTRIGYVSEVTVNGNYVQNGGMLTGHEAYSKMNVTGDVTLTGSPQTLYIWGMSAGGSVNHEAATRFEVYKLRVGKNFTQKAGAGEFDTYEFELPNAGSVITLTNGNANTLVLTHEQSRYSFTPAPFVDEDYDLIAPVRAGKERGKDSGTGNAPAQSNVPEKEIAGKHETWVDQGGKSYWYENGVRQGTYDDKQGVLGDDKKVRGREIADNNPGAPRDAYGNACWFWLDSIYDGAKAVSKEVWMPYIYNGEENWSEEQILEQAEESGDMAEQVIEAILSHGEVDEYGNAVPQWGKWVRYDKDGLMIKGWYTVEQEGVYLNLDGTDQYGNTYYYDPRTGLMAKGWVTIDGTEYHFDEITGVWLE